MTLAFYIPDCLKGRIVYVENDRRDIWDWMKKVYQVIENGLAPAAEQQPPMPLGGN